MWTQKFAQTFAAASILIGSALITSQAFAFNVQVAIAPDNTLPLILQAIGNAKKSLQVNIYELASPEVAKALIDQINRGVHVQILQEGEPVGGISAASRGLHAQIAQAMEAHPGCCSYGEMHKGAGGTRRFHYDHAKYIVIDQTALLLGSENYSPGGQPEPGTLGNRGWEVLVYDVQPARWFSQLFVKDSDPRNSDIVNLLRSGSASAMETQAFATADQRVPGRINPMLNASDGEIITSPDTSLNGLIGLIRGAKKTLDIEQMSFNVNWGTQASPLYTEILAAAHRGVRVRILLNDEYAFMNGGNRNGTDGTDGTGDDPLNWSQTTTSGKLTTNRKAVAAFTQAAQTQRLPIEARIANLRAMGVAYIHNKGMIVDGNITLISSINWTQNSITNNREAALALTSPQVAAYYGQAFNQDWTRSTGQGAMRFLNALDTLNDVQALEARGPVEGPVVVPPTTCPNSLNVSAKIGQFRAPTDLDPGYLALENQTLAGTFSRDGRDRRCILLGPGNLALEFRLDHNGTLQADLEGYTSSMKPFSVRADFAPGTQISDPEKVVTSQGYFLEGSFSGGGRKRRLGPAEMSLQAR
jgi:phosphatidylserine/phosphatidylglycerophosphate/cardiolipin synthase-like enzyme